MSIQPTPTPPYTTDRLQDDWIWYSPLLEIHDWFLDTTEATLYYGPVGTPTKEDIEFSVAESINHGETTHTPNSGDSPFQFGSIAEFAGAVENGDLVPLPTNTSISTPEGLLSITEQAVNYSPVGTNTDGNSLHEIHSGVSNLRQRDRGHALLRNAFGESPLTFTKSPLDADTKRESNPFGESQQPPRPCVETPPLFPDREFNPAEPIRPDYSKIPSEHPTISPNSLEVGRAEELLQQVETEGVTLACFSPPYNIGIDYDNANDNLDITDWYEMLTRTFRQLFRVIEPGGKVVVNIGKSFAKTEDAGRFMFYPLAGYLKSIALNNGFDFADEVIWSKRGFNGRGGGALLGSYPLPSTLMITQTHEHLLFFRKWTSERYAKTRTLPETGSERREESKLTKERWREITQSIWNIETVTQSNLDVDHGAVFPEELPKRVIQMASFKGDTVIDPFVGTGTTALAAKKAGREYIGFDMSSNYISHAEDRLEKTTFDQDGYVAMRDNTKNQQESRSRSQRTLDDSWG